MSQVKVIEEVVSLYVVWFNVLSYLPRIKYCYIATQTKLKLWRKYIVLHYH